jgi:hypothetical protein
VVGSHSMHHDNNVGCQYQSSSLQLSIKLFCSVIIFFLDPSVICENERSFWDVDVPIAVRRSKVPFHVYVQRSSGLLHSFLSPEHKHTAKRNLTKLLFATTTQSSCVSAAALLRSSRPHRLPARSSTLASSTYLPSAA